MFVAGDNCGGTRYFRKPNILRKRQTQEPPPQSIPPPKSEAKQPPTHRCSKPAHIARRPSHIRLDTYLCEEYRMRKLGGAGTPRPPADVDTSPPAPTPAPIVISVEVITKGNAENLAYEGADMLIKPERIPIEELLVNMKSDQETAQTYECGWKDCNLTFSSPEDLESHVALHAPPIPKPVDQGRTSPKPTPGRQLQLCCPAKNKGDSPSCDVIYQSREDVMKHIKENHTEEDAPHKCETCGRSFFWYSGLRAHSRVHSGGWRTLYACLWPGCERVFPQACRLKEHSRRHTGDKPYVCLHPSCGWAFRSASKLIRHTRRHTGERRFTCRLCGAAFLRAEHRREHEDRHARRAAHVCTAPGCTQKFSNKSSLYLHTKRVHPPPPAPPPSPPPPPLPDMAPHMPDMPAIDFMEQSECSTCRAARTHLPWPISRATARIDCDTLICVCADLLLQSRSHDQPYLSGGEGEFPQDLTALDNPHTMSHLLQEELMLTDATADESPLPVLLFNNHDSYKLHQDFAS